MFTSTFLSTDHRARDFSAGPKKIFSDFFCPKKAVIGIPEKFS
jgi:hypothetical protein